MAEPLISRQYRATLFKYRKFKHRLDRRLKNNTLAELSIHHRNRLLRTIERLKRRLATLQVQLKYTAAGIAMGAAIVVSDEAIAQKPTPLGSEFRVNTFTTGSQSGPFIGADADGDFVVAWNSNGQDGSNYGVYAQRYDALGAAQGPEFRVNTYTANDQTDVDIALDAGGGFVITWSSLAGQDGSSAGVYAQRYNGAGVAQGGEFRVNTYTTDNQISPSIAVDDSGDFVITWRSILQDGSSGGIYAQRYNSSGVAQGAEFQVNSSTTSNESAPSIAIDSAGDFVISWWTDSGIFARRYNATGVAQGDEFKVNTNTSNTAALPYVAIDSDGDFVITWQTSSDGYGIGVSARRYNSSGIANGQEFRVNSETASGQGTPTIAMDDDGDFVITWTSLYQDGSFYGVYAQRYDDSGVPQGGEFRVNTFTTGTQATSSIAMDSNGDFIVAWNGSNQDGSSIGVYAQRYTVNPPPEAIGSEFRVNTYTTNFQRSPSVGVDSDGGFVTTWTSVGQDGDSHGIYAQRYNTDGVAQGPEFKVNTYTTSTQTLSSIAMATDGDFVIVWMSFGQDGNSNGIYAQRYDAAGVAQDAEFQVNEISTGNQTSPSVAMDVDGDFVIAWTDGDIHFRRYNAAGVAQGGEFLANSTTGNPLDLPAVAMDAAGNFVITWYSFGNTDGSGSAVYAQQFDAAGVYVGSEFRVNTYTTGHQSEPSIGMDVDGDFVISWISLGQDGSSYGVYAQRYNSAAVAQGIEFRATAYTTASQHHSAVTMAPDGDFVIAWASYQQDGSDFGIYARQYNAAGAPQGVEFKANTFTTNAQADAAIAINPKGDLIVTWNSLNQDGSDLGIYARRFNVVPPPTPIGNEFQVHTSTTSAQAESSIAMNAAGDYVIAWQSNHGGTNEIMAQRYNAAGLSQGTEFQANTYTTNYQQHASVAMNTEGDFIVTWTSYGQDGSAEGVYARRYNAAGTPQGLEFQVNTYTTGDQRRPSVGMNDDGEFVIAWQSANQDGNSLGIYAQRFDASGLALGSEFPVNTYTTSAQTFAAVAMDQDGDFVVTWVSQSQDGSGNGTYAQRYNLAGIAQGAEFRVNTFIGDSQTLPSVAMDRDGDFVVAWSSYSQDGYFNGIYAQRYNASGVSQGAEFRVNSYTTGNQFNPSIAIDADGDFVVTWSSEQDGGGSGIYGQRYERHGVPRGPEFHVNTYTTGDQLSCSIATDADGDFVVAWNSDGQDGDGNGIYAQHFQSANPNLLPNLVTNAGLTFNEGATSTITSSELNTTDPDQPRIETIYEVIQLPVNGVLKNNGTPLNLNDTFTQQDIDNNVVTYAHDGTETTADEFHFNVTDGTNDLPGEAFSITVTPVSDAPVPQTNTGVAVNEGEEASILSAQLHATDVDNPATEIIYEITSLPENGMVKKDGVTLALNETFTQAQINNGLVTYTHDGGETIVDAFNFTVTDATTTLSEATFNITVNPLNDAPVVAVNTGSAINEGDEITISPALLSTTDVDDVPADIVYSVSAIPVNGELQKNGTALSLNETFTQADINSSLISYDHNGGETISDSFKFTVTDGTETLAEATFNATINPVNDPPTPSVNVTLNLDEGSEAYISDAQLLTADVDSEATTVVYTITGLPAHGALETGLGAIALNGTITQADLTGLALTYQHDGSETTSDSFNFTVTDGVATLAENTFNITINAVSDAPVLTINSTLGVDEGSEGTISSALLGTTDVDNAAGTIIYTLTVLPAYGELKNDGLGMSLNETFTEADLDIDLISYTNDGTESTVDTFTFTVSDGTTTLPQATFNILISAVSDAPVPQFNTGLTVNEGEEATVSGLTLNTVDVDDESTSITYTITALPLNGELRMSGTGIPQNGTFTQADLNLGFITYYHDGSETAFDSFKFTVSDGTTSLTEATFNVSVTPVSDAPLPQLNTGVTVYEGTQALVTGSTLNTTDVDNDSGSIIYTVTELPLHGELLKAGVGISLNGTFTQTHLNIAFITYSHDGGETDSDSFKFTVSDGTTTLTEATFNISIVPLSDAPLLSANATLAVDEGYEAAIPAALLNTTDVDNDATSIQYNVTEFPTNGEIRVSGLASGVFTQVDVDNGNVTYTHDGSETVSDSFKFTVSDGTTTLSQSTFNIAINPVSDAPIIAVNSALAVDEGGANTVLSAFLSTTDIDNAASAIVYTLTGLPANGELLKDGVSVSVNDTFTQADVNNNFIYFIHNGSEASADSFTFTVGDGTTTLPESTFNFTINPVNDAPFIAANAGLTVGEGAEATISSTMLNTTDVDNAASAIIYFATSLPANGELKKNGLTIPFNGSFTQADVNNGLVSFAHNGTETTSDYFNFTVSDGPTAAEGPTFFITVVPVSDAPVLSINTGLSVSEGDEGVISASMLSTTDVDNNASSLTYTVTGLPANGVLKKNGLTISINGTFAQADVNSGLVSFTHNGSETTSDSFNFTVSDGTTVLGEATFNITVSPLNDAPVLSVNGILNTLEGIEDWISPALLNTTDADNAASSITYTVTEVPLHGELRKNDIAVSPGDTFTQADIDHGAMSYWHDGTENFADSFKFSITDGTTLLANNQLSIFVYPAEDPPVVAVNTGAIVSEGGEVIISTSKLNSTDPEQGASDITYTLTQLPDNGPLLKNGVAVPGLNSTFTQADIDGGAISFQHNGTETVSDSFKFTVSDGSATLPEATFTITVSPVDDDPVPLNNTGLTIDEGGEGTISTGMLSTADVDTGFGSIVYTVTQSPAHGLLLRAGGVTSTFTQSDIDSGIISFLHNGGETTSDSFKFTVSDGETTLPEATFSININPVSDAPVLSTNAGLVVGEGDESTIPSTLLNTTDIDSDPTAITYTLTGLPSTGEVLMLGSALSLSASFSQDDVNNGLVTYQHDGSETTGDFFKFTVSDGVTSLPEATFNISIVPFSDAPVVSTNAGLTVDEGGTATIGSTLLNSTDIDDTAAELTYQITATPLNGSLLKNAIVITSSDTFTQQDVDNNLVSYQHDGSETTGDSFTFDVSDGTNTVTGLFQVTINPVADELLSQNITFAALGDKTDGDAAFTLSATASSTLAVAFTVVSGPATISGATLTITGPGPITVRASQAGDSAYDPAADVDQTFCSNPKKATITVQDNDTAAPKLVSSAPTGNQWFKANQPLAGETNSILIVTQQGVYKVQVTVGGCVGEMSSERALVVTGGLPNFSNEIVLSPNPVADFVHIDGLSGGVSETTVTDMSGRTQHLPIQQEGTQLVVDVRGISRGTYLIAITDGDNIHRLKFIKY